MDFKINERTLTNLSFTMEKDQIYPIGIDFGGKCLIKKKSDNYILFKVNGHQTWAGIGMTAYTGTTYYLVKIEIMPKVEWSGPFNRPDGSLGRGQILYDCEPGKAWKHCLKWFDKFFIG
jgi:hypothetical protein